MEREAWKRVSDATRWVERERRSSGRRVSQPIRSSGKPVRLRYKSMGSDHLVCRSWDGTTEGTTDIYVAKPWLLRRTTTRTGYTYSYSNDYTRTSTKTADSSTENQVLVPSYEVNDNIWAVTSTTGVTVGTQTVSLIDLNLDGRQWAKVAT